MKGYQMTIRQTLKVTNRIGVIERIARAHQAKVSAPTLREEFATARDEIVAREPALGTPLVPRRCSTTEGEV